MNRLSLTLIATASITLSSCSMLSWKYMPWKLVSQQQQQQPTANKPQGKDPKSPANQAAGNGDSASAETSSAVVPTPEQQASAATIIATQPGEQTGAATTAAPKTGADAAPTITPYTEETPSAYSSTTIPGKSGLRMGRFAPPEEAASAGENANPTPNAAEQRGLRSPKLPRKLPLSIDGQTQPATE